MTEQRGELPELTPAQGEIMEIIWDCGEVSASEVRRILARTREVARNTVRTLLERMEEKGWITHREEGRTFLYAAAQPREATIGQKVQEIVETVCGGSAEALVTARARLSRAQCRRADEDPSDARPGPSDQEREGRFVMSTLMNEYPGDRALNCFLIVALGVAVLSSAAWVVSWRLPRRPATRHLVLVSALFCCLGMPLLAMIFTATGWTLIAIPLLTDPPAGSEPDRALVMAAHTWVGPATHGSAESIVKRRLSPQTEALLGASPSGLDPSHRGSGESTHRAAGVAVGSGGKPPEVPDLERGINPGAGSARYRAAATLVLIAWGFGSVLLLLNLARNYGLIRRLCRATSSMGVEALQLMVDDVSRLLDVRRLPRVVVSRRVMTPFAVGFRSTDRRPPGAITRGGQR